MRTVHKYGLLRSVRPVMEQVIPMPQLAEILTVEIVDAAYGPQINLYALVDTEMPMEEKTFHIIGTGEELPQNVGSVSYIGTISRNHQVFHVFTDL